MKNRIFLLLLTFMLSSFASYASWSEAEFKKMSESWTLNSDGSQEYRQYKEIKLFTHTAMNATYGETFIEYNPKFQEVKIHESYVVHSDGTKFPTPANSFVEVLPRTAQNSAEYNHLVELVVVHMGLELGATIVLDYSIISKSGYLGEIDICKQISQSSPVKQYTMTFNLPESSDFSIAFSGITARAKKSVKDGMQQISYSFKNMAASSREQQIGLTNHSEPSFAANSYKSQKDAFSKLYAQFKSSPKIQKIAKELTDGKSQNCEKIEAIVDFVKNEIAQSDLTMAQTNYTIRPLDKVLKSAYATQLEKTALMNALLNGAGIKSEPVAISFYDLSASSYALSAIESVGVKCGDSIIDSKGVSNSVKHSSKVLTLNGAELVSVSQKPSSIKYDATITWCCDKATANSTIVVGNQLLSSSKNAASSIASLKDAECKCDGDKSTVSGTSEVSFSNSGDYMMVSLPSTKLGIAQNASYAALNSSRETAIILECENIDESYSYTVEIPSGYTLASSSKAINVSLSNSVGSVNQSYSVDGNKLTINRSIKINKSMISKAEYSNFRALVVKWNTTYKNPLLLKK